MMKIYAASISAISIIDGREIFHHKAISFQAKTEEEALGIAYKTCLSEYPRENHFHSQSIAILMVPNDIVQA